LDLINSGIADYATISIGAATARVKFTHQYMDYIERADESLYMSRNTGRGKYTRLECYDLEGGSDEV